MMVETVTRYLAEDGTEHHSEAAAEEWTAFSTFRTAAIALLNPKPAGVLQQAGAASPFASLSMIDLPLREIWRKRDEFARLLTGAPS